MSMALKDKVKQNNPKNSKEADEKVVGDKNQ